MPFIFTIFSIFTWIEIFILFIAYFPVQLIVFLITFPFDRRRRVIHYIGSAFCHLALIISPVFRVIVSGKEHLDRSKAHVVVMNHQSLLDILLSFILYYPCKMIGKKELSRIPFLGWELVLFGDIFVDRKNRKSQFEAIRRMNELLESGDSLLVYPEGTRTRDGNIAEFKKGAFRSAAVTGTSVLPVVLDGAYQALPKNGLIVKRVFTLHMRVMPPIPVEKGADTAELARRCHDLMSNELEILRRGKAGKDSL